jgi:carbon starvation protein
MTIAALLIQLRSFFEQGNYFLLVLDIVVLVAAILVAMECASALKRLAQRDGRPAEVNARSEG